MPQAKKIRGSDEANFLFVNQNVTSLLSTDKDAQLSQSKNRHVQLQRFTKRKETPSNNSQPQASSASSPCESHQNTTGSVTTSDSDTASSCSPPPEVQTLNHPHPKQLRWRQHRPSQSSKAKPEPKRSSNHSRRSSQDDSQSSLPSRMTGNAQCLPYRSIQVSKNFQVVQRSSSVDSDHISKASGHQTKNELQIRPPVRVEDLTSINIDGLDLNPSTPFGIPQSRWRFAIDPFKSTTLTVHPCAASVVEYYTSAVIPAIFSADSRASPDYKLRHQLAFQKDMHACMTEPAHMYAMLAYASARMLRIEGQFLLPSLGENEKAYLHLHFKTKAIEMIRSRVGSNQLDHNLLQAVCRLMGTEMLLENYGESKTHVRAMSIIIEALGGIGNLDSYTKEKILIADLFSAFQCLSKPHLPLTWDPGNLSKESGRKILPHVSSPLRTLGARFSEVLLSEVFHPDMKTIFSDLIQVVRMSVYSLTQPELTAADFQWLTLRKTAIEHRLLSFQPTHKQVGKNRYIQECMRLALLFWMALTLGNNLRTNTAARLDFHLRQTLERSDLEDLWYPHSDLLLWILTTGAFVAADAGELHWFQKAAAKVAHRLGVSEERELKKLLQGYFYVDELQHGDLTRLATKMLPGPSWLQSR